MVVVVRGHPEADGDLVEERRCAGIHAASLEIGARVEHQFVDADTEVRFGQDRRVGPPVRVGDGRGEPHTLTVLDPPEIDGEVRGGLAAGGVENMCRQVSCHAVSPVAYSAPFVLSSGAGRKPASPGRCFRIFRKAPPGVPGY